MKEQNTHISKRAVKKAPIYIGLLLFSAAALLPFLYMLATAMTPHSYSLDSIDFLYMRLWFCADEVSWAGINL